MIPAFPRNLRLPLIFALLVAAVPGSASGSEQVLSFEDRLACQEAIERVYYSHQIGATRPFEEAVPRDVLERKVRTSLLQSVALEQRWKTPLTAEALERELERIAGNTRLPERLLEVYGALGSDSVLIQECLARSVLVDRLARSFFSRDQRIHGRARREAEELRARLASGGLDPRAEDPHRSEVEIVRENPDQGGSQARPDSRNGRRLKDRRLVLSPLEFDERRHRAPEEVGQIGQVVEERERFVVSVALEEGSGWARLASYAVPKESWDHWWRLTSVGLDAGRAAAVALPLVRVPDPVERARSEPVDDQVLPAEPWSGGDPEPLCAAQEAWRNGVLDGPPYRARSGHTAVWTGSVMVAWGGETGGGADTNSGGRYDPLTDTWTPTTTVHAPRPRGSHTAVWTGSLMIVWGGDARTPVGNGIDYLNTGGRYDPLNDTWTKTTTVNAPQARFRHTAVWTGSLMVIWGGHHQPSDLNTGGRYDPASDTWSPTTMLNAPGARDYHTAVWTGSVMVVWGGFLSAGGRYHPLNDTWTQTTTLNAPEGRISHTAVWTGTEMVVWGGLRSGDLLRLDTGGRYDPVSNSWTPTTTVNVPEARSDHTAIWTGSLMVVWGGESDRFSLNTGGRYDPASDTWSPTTSVDAPEARSSHTAVWTGTLMVVWGGYLADEEGHRTYFNNGGRYDPVADSWIPIWPPASFGTAPEARSGHTAVWTGTVMVVWGGDGRDSYFNTGSRYDPLTDSWSPTSTLDAPEAREAHTAVWTGNLMVVWGGRRLDEGRVTLFNNGGRYDPLSDSWSPTSTLNAPVARNGHTAVWTASLMIVWGGIGAFDYLNSGGRYDPLNDIWTSTTILNAPKKRTSHTAVWTGSVMVVWGGWRTDGHSSHYSKTGGRYDPLSDTWAPTSTVGAPKPRTTGAVWTGSLMVVWGGYGYGGHLDTGGRYDPVADTWSPTTTANAPKARSGHTAVWGGNKVIVWGGVGAAFVFKTGGRYDPVADAWAPTTTANAPEARAGHRAVWTGSSMLVWGGSEVGLGRYIDTGGQYGLFAPDSTICTNSGQ